MPGRRRVRVQIDNAIFAVAVGTQSWSFNLNTAALVDGPHTIRLSAPFGDHEE